MMYKPAQKRRALFLEGEYMADGVCPVVGRKKVEPATETEACHTAECRPVLFEVPENLCLNLGGGDVELAGFRNIDRKFGGELWQVTDPSGAVYPDNCANEIYASHCLEHFPANETAQVLAEWVRVLKPGGLIRIAVPNLDWILEHRDHPMFEGYLMGGQTDENDYHHAVFTEKKLRRLMEEAGLVDIFPWTSSVNDCASLPVSLNLMGTKAGAVPVLDLANVRIVGCLSAPRVGFNDTWGCIATVLAEWGIPMMPHRGAFWEQVMQNMLLAAVKGGYQFAVTFDYDSAFTRADFEALLSYMIQHPDVDAVAPFQPMRERSNTALCGLKTAPSGGTETVSAAKAIEAQTAHFGCTVFRLDRLKAIPLPWLWSQPGKNGEWTIEDGKVDADSYFWHKFNEHGRKLHVLPWVRIGHIEPMITMLGEHKDERTGKVEMKTITMHSSHWMNRVFAPQKPKV